MPNGLKSVGGHGERAGHDQPEAVAQREFLGDREVEFRVVDQIHPVDHLANQECRTHGFSLGLDAGDVGPRDRGGSGVIDERLGTRLQRHHGFRRVKRSDLPDAPVA